METLGGPIEGAVARHLCETHHCASTQPEEGARITRTHIPSARLQAGASTPTNPTNPLPLEP
eukprot:5005785-Amphidinium_carterae.1